MEDDDDDEEEEGSEEDDLESGGGTTSGRRAPPVKWKALVVGGKGKGKSAVDRGAAVKGAGPRIVLG